MGICCCRPPPDDDHAGGTKAAKSGMNNAGTYGTNDTSPGEQSEKDRKVKFDDAPKDGGPPADEATEATPLLDSPVVPGEEASKDAPTITEGKATTLPETTEVSPQNPATETEQNEEAAKEIVSEAAAEEPSTPAKPRSISESSAEKAKSPSGESTSDFVFSSPESLAVPPQEEKKRSKSVGKKLKKGFGKFGRKKRASSAGESTSETSSQLSSQVSGSQSTLDAPK